MVEYVLAAVLCRCAPRAMFLEVPHYLVTMLSTFLADSYSKGSFALTV